MDKSENEIFLSFLEEVNDHFDLFQISKLLTNKLLNEFLAETCELKLLDGDFFDRLHLSFILNGKTVDNSDEAEKIFGEKATPYTNSLSGSVIETKKPYHWIESRDESFLQHATKLKEEGRIYFESASKFLNAIPSKRIVNFIIIPINLPYFSNGNVENNFKVQLCLHLHNVQNFSLDETEIIETQEHIKKIISLTSVHIFNSLFYKKTKNEIEIQNKINEIIQNTKVYDSIIDEIVKDFGSKLRSSMNTIWYYDKDYQLLGLHSVSFNKKYCGNPDLQEIEFYDLIKNPIYAPRVLKINESVMGELVSNPNKQWVKELNVITNQQYKWNEINRRLKISKFIAIPIRDGENIIAILGFHPNLKDSDFLKTNSSYFLTFLQHITIHIKFLIESQFHEKSTDLAEHLKKQIKNADIFYNTICQKIAEVTNAEACSIFEVKTKEKSICLLTSTGPMEQGGKSLKNLKVYDIDEKSITGAVALQRTKKIIYDVQNAPKYYNDIKGISNSYVETTESGIHTSYIAVPVGADLENASSFYIIRCINKKPSQKFRPLVTDLFHEYDIHLLNNIGYIFERYRGIQDVIQERNDLLDVILHEIQNPIASIRGKMDFINKKIDIKHETLKIKLCDIDRMIGILRKGFISTTLLNDLFQEKSIETNPKKIKISNSIKDAIYWVNPELNKYHMDLSNIELINISDHMEIEVDPDHFMQVLYNLIINAIKYRAPGKKIKIQIEMLQKNDGSVLLNFNDWGIGIDEFSVDKIFHHGYRSSYATLNKIKGKGFGLWLCHNLLTSNGLTILLSNLSEPTTFQIIIPSNLIKQY